MTAALALLLGASGPACRRTPVEPERRAVHRSGAAGDLSYISTAGGAFLEWMEGKTLPGVAALEAASGA